MLKLNASYSKKVPAEGEYTSQSYHASIEVELPDGLSSEQLNGKIHETFELVRNSVEAELHGSVSVIDIPAAPVSGGSRTQGELASPKQISYLLSLAQKRGITAQQLASRYHVATVEQLSRKQCSEIINNWKAA